jgi:hypothetical protein
MADVLVSAMRESKAAYGSRLFQCLCLYTYVVPE